MIEKARRTWPRTTAAVTTALTTALLCTVVASTLQGCVGMAIGTAVVGTLAATDRRTLGAQTEDQEIIIKSEARIPQVVGGAGHVNINSFNRKVLLTGEVRDDAMKQAVEREVVAIEGAKTIVNELEVGPVADFTSRSNDVLISGKVKASFIDEKNLYATAIKVTTERGAVYLMGRVTQREADLATEIARGVGGVTKVVRVFELIGEDEFRQLTSTPAAK
jgi:osmotically-inducible protein OsmY